MKRRLIFAIILLILFSTISIKENIVITKFNLEKISVENNYLLKKEDITKLLIPIYNKNLLLLNYSEIEKFLIKIVLSKVLKSKKNILIQ